MIKKILAYGLSAAVVLALSTSIPTLDRSVDRRIAAIRTSYGIVVNYDDHGALYAHRQLDQIEHALTYLGPTFTKKVSAVQVASYTPLFQIRISNERPSSALCAAGQFHITTESSTLHLFPSAHYIPTSYDILHEFGHAAAYLSNETVNPLADFKKINGAYGQEEFDAARYVSRYAMSDVSEDFAEVFAVMVINGGRLPTGIGKDSTLYQKYCYMQQYLVTYLGTGSRAARQASAYLNICLEEQPVNSQAVLNY